MMLNIGLMKLSRNQQKGYIYERFPHSISAINLLQAIFRLYHPTWVLSL